MKKVETNTAEQKYKAYKNQILKQIEDLKKGLKEYDKSSATKNWGDVGTLNHITTELEEVLKFIVKR